MFQKAAAVAVTERQRLVLEEATGARRTPCGRAERARIVLMSAEQVENVEQAERLQVDRQRIRRWRDRWAAAEAHLVAAEQAGSSDRDLELLIWEVLSDRPRPGGPVRFTPEQVTDIIALACEQPSDSGLPVSHWTPPELAREAVKRGIVDSISPRQVDRFLKRNRSPAAQEPVLAHVAREARRPRTLRPAGAGALCDVPRSSDAADARRSRGQLRREDRHPGA